MIINKDLFDRFRNEFYVVVICIVFVLIRLPGIHLPYYQDEWKNIAASAHINTAGEFFAHPPLMQILSVIGYSLFGPDYFRIFPLIFSIISVILLYLVLKKRKQEQIIFSLALFSFCFYSILGSLMPDVDGSILPLFFLTSLYAYDRFNESHNSLKWKWFTVMIFSLLLGFLTKLSFIIVIGVFLFDYILENRKNLNLKKWVLLSGLFAGFIVLYTISLYIISFFYPAFDMSIMFGHASQFTEKVGRNWIQIIVQGIKAVFYLSPLLFAPLLFISKDLLKKIRIFIIYLAFGFLFYFIVFDFSQGALDKYLMFSIIPLAVIVGYIFENTFSSRPSPKQLSKGLIIGLVISIILIVLNFLPHQVLALYPKTLWFSRVIHGKWLMLNPFNGGSGPMGFYVSFLFLISSYLISFCLAIIGYLKKNYRQVVLIAIAIIGIAYNFIITEELFYGKINGSSANVLKESILFISERSDIREVVTYNDIGAHKLSELSKYSGRFYAAPQFEEGHRLKFSEYKGDYLVVGIPPLYDGFYRDFFSKCDILFETRSKNILGNVYRCK